MSKYIYNGGTFETTGKKSAVHIADDASSYRKITAVITGGNFNAPTGVPSFTSLHAIYPNISAGTYSTRPEDKYLINTVKTYVVEDKFIVAPKATDVIISEENIEMKEGVKKTLTSKILPVGNLETITWSSSDTSVATVDTSGNVTAIAKGTAVITASVNDLKDTCAINIYPKVKTIALSKDNLTLEKGRFEILLATINPSDAREKVEWTSSNPDVATVDANGNVIAVTKGNAVITASADGVNAICNVLVFEKEDKPMLPLEPSIPVNPVKPPTSTEPTDPEIPVTPDAPKEETTEKDVSSKKAPQTSDTMNSYPWGYATLLLSTIVIAMFIIKKKCKDR